MLQHIKPKTPVILEGPYGVFTEERRSKNDVVLIAAGIGAPPIRALAENIAAKPGEVSIIYRVRDKEDAPLISELQEIARRRGFYLHILSGNRRSSHSWLPKEIYEHLSDEKALLTMVPKVANSDVYVCGPEGMVESVRKAAREVGVPKNRFHDEAFAFHSS